MDHSISVLPKKFCERHISHLGQKRRDISQDPPISRQSFDPKTGHFGHSQGWCFDQFWSVFRDSGPHIRSRRPFSGSAGSDLGKDGCYRVSAKTLAGPVFHGFRAESRQNRLRRSLWRQVAYRRHISLLEEFGSHLLKPHFQGSTDQGLGGIWGGPHIT